MFASRRYAVCSFKVGSGLVAAIASFSCLVAWASEENPSHTCCVPPKVKQPGVGLSCGCITPFPEIPAIEVCDDSLANDCAVAGDVFEIGEDGYCWEYYLADCELKPSGTANDVPVHLRVGQMHCPGGACDDDYDCRCIWVEDVLAPGTQLEWLRDCHGDACS